MNYKTHYLKSYDKNVDDGGEDTAERLPRHHSAHIVRREFARHTLT